MRLPRLLLVSLLLLKSIQFYGQAKALPNASFTFSPIDPLVNQAVKFSVNGTVSSGTSYYWGFGDGTTITTSNSTITHSYGQAGNYTVSLTITSQAAVATLTRYVAVFTYIP